mgnify:CR=1 FL=1
MFCMQKTWSFKKELPHESHYKFCQGDLGRSKKVEPSNWSRMGRQQRRCDDHRLLVVCRKWRGSEHRFCRVRGWPIYPMSANPSRCAQFNLVPAPLLLLHLHWSLICAFATRLWKYLWKLIHPSWYGFIVGRNILLMWWMLKWPWIMQAYAHQELIMVQLDLEVAYDHVNWSFVFGLMHIMCFGSHISCFIFLLGRYPK